MKPRRARLLALAWTLGILAACSIPGRDLPRVDIVSFDKVVHFLMFAGFAWLWMRALEGTPARKTGKVLAAGLAYAVASEIYQGLLPLERTPDPVDALANALGVLVAVLGYRLSRARIET